MDDKIKALVISEIKEPDWDWQRHIGLVIKYSRQLCDKLDADFKVCEMTAWLHDLAKIKYPDVTDHHLKGAEEAEEILKEHGYDADFISKVKHCILTHSSDSTRLPVSMEAKIVASADAMTHFDMIPNLCFYNFRIADYSIKECYAYLEKKLTNSYNKILLPEAKEMARPKFEAAKLLLGF